jgi:hypothetical protein
MLFIVPCWLWYEDGESIELLKIAAVLGTACCIGAAYGILIEFKRLREAARVRASIELHLPPDYLHHDADL